MSAQVVDIEKIIAPLAGAKRCGESAKYEPEYESLEAEVAKEAGITPQPVDWGSVLRNAQTILETKSKDLLAAAYLTYALFDRRGYEGLASGLKACRTLVQNFWEDVYPEKKRMRGRVAAFEWLMGKLERVLEQKRPVGGDAAALADCTAVLEELGKLLETHLGRDAPDLNKVQRILRDHARDAERPAATAAASTPGASAVAGGVVQVTTEQDIPKALRQVQAMARAVAAFIRAQKLEDARSYRMTRIGAWILIDQLPMQQNGTTQLAAVPAAVVQKYAGYVTEQKFAAMIPEVEESFSKSPFWLDAHRLTVTALENLGPNFAAAKAVVISELAAFLKRLPELMSYKFVDGTPFANEQTRLWIEQEVMAGASTGAHETAPVATGDSDAATWIVGQREAKQLAVKGKIADALALLQAGAQQSNSQRERFCWELAQAKFCVDAGMQQVAVPQLEHLDRQSEKFVLDDWEPALALEVARVLLLCYAQFAEKNKKLKDAYAPKAESLYARICRLDINAALKLDLKAFQ